MWLHIYKVKILKTTHNSNWKFRMKFCIYCVFLVVFGNHPNTGTADCFQMHCYTWALLESADLSRNIIYSGHRCQSKGHWKYSFANKQWSRKVYCLLQLDTNSTKAELLCHQEGVTGCRKIDKTLPQVSVWLEVYTKDGSFSLVCSGY